MRLSLIRCVSSGLCYIVLSGVLHMASVLQIKGSWRAQIRRKGVSESKTFQTKRQAEAWARQREADLDAGRDAPARPARELTVSDVIKAYRKIRDASRPISDQSNEHYMLKALNAGLGGKTVDRLTPQDLVTYCTIRAEASAGPYTLNMEMSKLGTVFKYGGIQLRAILPDVVGQSRPLLVHLRLIGGGGKRERRPTADEIDRILEHMTATYGEVYAEAVRFAIASAMRRGEICALKHSDIDANKVATIWRKHPRKGQVEERVPLLDDAWEIVSRQPASEDGRIFPIEAGTLSKYFTWTCRALSIPDLHLHDMRHEGASRLFEEGLQIEHVALVTGHKSWNMLRRYTQLKPEDVQAASSRNRSKDSDTSR